MVKRPDNINPLLRLCLSLACLLVVVAAVSQSPSAVYAAAEPGDKTQFTATTITGDRFKSSDLRDRLVIVYFWRSDFLSTQNQIAKLRLYHNSYNKAGLEVVGVSRDTSKETLIAHLKDNRTPWQQIFDAEQQPPLSQVFTANSLTDALLFAPDGTLLWRGHIAALDEPLRQALAKFAPKALGEDGQLVKYTPGLASTSSATQEQCEAALESLRSANTAMKQNNLQLMTRKLEDVQIETLADGRVLGQAQLLRRQLDRHLADWPHFKSDMEADPTAFRRLEELIRAGDPAWESPASPLDPTKIGHSNAALGATGSGYVAESAPPTTAQTQQSAATPAIDTSARDAEVAAEQATQSAHIAAGQSRLRQANEALLEGRFVSMMDLIDAVPDEAIGDPQVTELARSLRQGFASKAQTSPAFRSLLKNRADSVARFRVILEGKTITGRAGDRVTKAHPLVIEEKLREAEESRLSGKHGRAYEVYVWLTENAVDGPAAIAHTHLAQYRSDKKLMLEVRGYLADSALAKAQSLEKAGEKEQARLAYEAVVSEYSDTPVAKRAEAALSQLK